MREMFAIEAMLHDLYGAVCLDPVVNLLFGFCGDQQGRSAIASTKTRNLANAAVGGSSRFQPVFELLLERAGPA